MRYRVDDTSEDSLSFKVYPKKKRCFFSFSFLREEINSKRRTDVPREISPILPHRIPPSKSAF